MKKIITALFFMIALYSCAKKITGSAAKVVETPPSVTNVPLVKDIAPNAPSAPEPPNAQDMAINPEAPVVGPLPVKAEVKPVEDKKKMAMIATGKEVYSVKCSKCHEAHEPKEFNEAKWVKLIDWMGPRAKLEANDKEAVLAYVKANAKK